MVRLEPAELDDEEVVLGVGDLGRIERVVQLVGVGDLLAQLGRPVGRLLGDPSGSRLSAMPAPTTTSGSCAS